MRGRRRHAPVAVAAIALLIAFAGCGDGGDSGSDAGHSTDAQTGQDYIARANAICRQGVREAERIGRGSASVDPSNIDTITAIFVRPGISLLERQAEQLRRLDAPADAEDFNTYVGLYDPAIVLVRERVRAALAGDAAEVQRLGEAMDQLTVDSRVAASGAGLDDCDVDISRQIVLAAAGK